MALILLTLGFVGASAQDVDYTSYVDTFFGSDDVGHTFPGVVAEPYAMVKLGPDCESGTDDAYSGYLADGNITGFSMMHESGTGGAPKYGVVSQMPVVGEVSDPTADLSRGRASPDEASVGYYHSSLDNGVEVELAGTAHAGLYQYSFPSADTNNIVVDVSHFLPSFRGLGWEQNYSGGNISVNDDGSYQGSGTYNGGWNLSPDWTIHFCGEFDQTPSSTSSFPDDNAGSVFTFNVDSVVSRVGISFISQDKACQNLQAEIPKGTQLQDLVNQAKSKWNTEIFSKITTTGGSDTEMKQLYTSLYGMNLIPSNRTGENPGWDSEEPYYDDIFTLWDLARCSTALQQIVQPKAYEEQIRSLIDIWRHDGWLPDGRSSNFNGRTQGGSNADNVLADAYVKGVRGGVNWEDGFAAMKTDAEQVPPNNDDPSAPDSSTKEGRGALPDWKEYGYITPTYSRAVSRAIEYAANDFGLYQVAKGLGKTKQARKYLKRSRYWRNHWNDNATSLGFSGFLVPRNADGTFQSQDPLDCGGCYWGDAYYEGLPWEYSNNAHHDVETLIEYAGGHDRFVERLDKFFEPGVYDDNSDFNSTIFNPSNEPSFTTPFLYNFANRQDLAVKAARTNAKAYYTLGASGLPGNSDAGAMQTWLLWNMIGLYPLTGQTTFFIGSPWFDSVNIDLGDGKTLKVTTTGGSEDAFYVQSLKVNGRNWKKNWVTWDDVFASGGTLDFVLGNDPKSWDTGPTPSSPATEKS